MAALEVNHGVGDDLAGAVVGNLTAAVDLDDGDVAAQQEVFGFAGQPLGEYGRVFNQPDFIFGVGRARGVEGFHGFKGGGVVGFA